MLKAISAFFAMFFTAFTALNRIANAADKLASDGEERADHYLTVSRLERAQEVKDAKARLAAKSKASS